MSALVTCNMLVSSGATGCAGILMLIVQVLQFIFLVFSCFVESAHWQFGAGMWHVHTVSVQSRWVMVFVHAAEMQNARHA